MSRNIVFEGWLTKSPPSKRIWRTKWRRRWFALRQSGELPGQYFLDYYADRNCRRLKGTINLDLCEQVDAGLHMERAGNGTLDPKLRGSVFTIQTQSRTYHLEADCEAEMEKWVSAIIGVCGLRATDDDVETYEYTPPAAMSNNIHYVSSGATGPYIPISECITGVRNQDGQNTYRSFNNNLFEPRRVVGPYHSNLPLIIITDYETKESRIYEEEEEEFVTRPFTKLAVNPTNNHGPPVPPRPYRTLEHPVQDGIQGGRASQPQSASMPRDPMFTVQGSMPWYSAPGTPYAPLRSPQRSPHHYATPHSPSRMPSPSLPHTRRPVTSIPRRMPASNSAWPPAPNTGWTPVPTTSRAPVSNAASRSPTASRAPVPNTAGRGTDDEEEIQYMQPMQYCNLPPVHYPPPVDRALKPRSSSYSIGNDSMSQPQGFSTPPGDLRTSDTLQYLDLDLPITTPPPPLDSNGARRNILHGQSMSNVDSESAYKVVDFVMTDALNKTKKEAEHSRNFQH